MKELIRALRCCSASKSECDHNCKYYYVTPEEEIQAFLEATGQRRSDFKEDFWGGCDGDRICRDAADALERVADAVPVVRCKDCLNYNKFKYADGGMCMVSELVNAAPDEFCSRGVRKEDGK